MITNYIFLDTEGKEELSEIAILDYNGNLIYEAFTESHPNNTRIHLKLKSLAVILNDLKAIAQNNTQPDSLNKTQSKTIICHYADHDRQLIRRSYANAQIPFPPLKFGCTWELAKQTLPNALSYSLEYLSKHLNLKVKNKRFNQAQAHTARYDAEFTHQLFLKLQSSEKSKMQSPVQFSERSNLQSNMQSNMQNPFASSRVDTPFQSHPDFRNVYAAEFELLKTALSEIKANINNQSRGAIIVGVAGSGKTHLIMRMAQELLKTNRLLFIRQPNNADAVLYHIYSRIIESFAEKVAGSDSYTQLELLIANSFVNILSRSPKFQANQRGKDILTALQNDALSLYRLLGKEGAQKNLENWKQIERHITDWWNSNYAAAGYSSTILQGIIRFCRYTDPLKRELTRRWLAAQELEPEACVSIGLTNWKEDMSREEFALEAIAVFGKLSILDQPLIIVFDQLEGLGLARNLPILESFGESVKEILTHVPNSLVILNLFPDRWQQFQTSFDNAIIDRLSQYQIRLNRPSPEKLKQILQIKAGTIELDTLFLASELTDILSQNSIRAILNRASAYFRSKYQNIPLPEDDYVPLEIRVQQLESVLKQIAQLVTTIIPSLDPNLAIDREIPLINELPEISTPNSILPTVDNQIERYLQSQLAELDLIYDRPTIISDSDDIGKLATIMEAFGKDIDHLRLGRTKLPEHLLINGNGKSTAIGFLNSSSTIFTNRIKSFNQLTVNHPHVQFKLIRDEREPVVTGKIGKEEIAKLNHSLNGKFTIMIKSDRVHFELIYKTIIDIQNQDLEIDFSSVLQALTLELGDYWLLELIETTTT